MYVGEAYEIIQRLRRDFRKVLEQNYEELNEFLEEAAAECYGEIDERIVSENLKEEYLLYKEEKAA